MRLIHVEPMHMHTFSYKNDLIHVEPMHMHTFSYKNNLIHVEPMHMQTFSYKKWYNSCWTYAYADSIQLQKWSKTETMF